MNDQKSIWEEKHAAGQHQKWDGLVRALAKDIVDELSPGSNLLELGCGTGSDARFFAQHGVNVIATDFSKTIINQNQSQNQYTNLQYTVLNMEEQFPYDDASFDHVYAYLSLHYFSDAITKKIIGETARVLRPHGKLYFTCKSVEDPKFREGKEIDVNTFVRKGHLRHFFTPEYVHEILENNFEVRKITESSFDMYGDKSAFVNCWALRKVR